MDTLVLFLTLMGRLSAFHHGVWCQPWLCHIWPLLCSSILLLYPIYWEFYHERMLNFVKCFFYIYCDDHMTFTLHSLNMMYHVYWFAYAESSLHLRDKSHLVMMCNFLNVLVILFCKYFVRIFASILPGILVSSFLVPLSGFSIRIMLVS